VERAEELANRFGPRIHAAPLGALAERLAGADLFVNTTSLGMDDSDAIAIDFSAMRAGALVTDIVYVPLVTPILGQAKEQGMRIADGLGMLLHQAVPGFEKWFGKRPDVTPELRAMIIADMEKH
jgi:shikimate dehydrogenase